jgi:hypothetical protein
MLATAPDQDVGELSGSAKDLAATALVSTPPHATMRASSSDTLKRDDHQIITVTLAHQVFRGSLKRPSWWKLLFLVTHRRLLT